ncbi:RidA family protein [Congregibacter litoralis]|uniref:Putative translation initiation inhibitor, yjgF family n=1 Tax=Congregibacter litoralis KT71 TaxID=314285 RepID=A4A6I3_9GAMM|nr:RidA family protein [Congregibacter litoralis]EAQ98630.1 putative translation initiation inhibitor, yjgF family [Congregibacter litoralis KT71]
MNRFSFLSLLAGGVLAVASLSVSADDITRNKTPGSDFPIAQSVQVPGASELIFVSGAVPKPVVEGGDPDDPATYGDTEIQTVSVLKEVQSRLQRLGLDMGDVVMMRAYLVGTPETDGRMDFAGFMRGYTQFFGTEAQPNLPSRSAFQIAGLARAGWFVEIEVVAARSPD